MNILIISQYFWPEMFRINDLAAGLVDRGHSVTVLTGKPNYPGGKFYPGYRFLNRNKEYFNKIQIIRSPVIPRGKSKIQLALNYLSFVFFASITAILKCKRPDVIFVYEPSPITVALPAIFYKKIKKVPILFWVQDLWPESVTAVGAVRSKKILAWLEKLVYFIYKRCDYILTTSKGYFEPIKRYQIAEEKLKFFPQTAETLYQPIENAAGLSEEKLLPQGFRIIFSGNIGVAQDVETIVKAALLLKNQKNIKWIFLGDGSKREWLQAEIKRFELEETVYWLGQHPVETMPRFFSCADALLVTLKKDPVFTLTIPAKIQSYLACAKPILASLDGEGKRVIEESSAGMVAGSGDSTSLADIVMKMYSLSLHDRVQMGLEGRAYFNKHFARDVLLQNLENWMQELRSK
ncbi:MAG: hypothetical protein ACD_60C00009G0017 [uncultured bacterium]|nr:MAG: hypothetical protein ACD_60C00009G0017 [uncultured bacterium]